MGSDTMPVRVIVVVLAAFLMASAMSLVTSRHHARGLFADLEAAQQLGRQTEAEGNRLRIELGRAGQPAAIEAAARRLGMRPIDPDHTALLPPAARPAQP
jgi:cell division protein FtsL